MFKRNNDAQNPRQNTQFNPRYKSGTSSKSSLPPLVPVNLPIQKTPKKASAASDQTTGFLDGPLPENQENLSSPQQDFSTKKAEEKPKEQATSYDYFFPKSECSTPTPTAHTPKPEKLEKTPQDINLENELKELESMEGGWGEEADLASPTIVPSQANHEEDKKQKAKLEKERLEKEKQQERLEKEKQQEKEKQEKALKLQAHKEKEELKEKEQREKWSLENNMNEDTSSHTDSFGFFPKNAQQIHIEQQLKAFNFANSSNSAFSNNQSNQQPQYRIMQRSNSGNAQNPTVVSSHFYNAPAPSHPAAAPASSIVSNETIDLVEVARQQKEIMEKNAEFARQRKEKEEEEERKKVEERKRSLQEKAAKYAQMQQEKLEKELKEKQEKEMKEKQEREQKEKQEKELKEKLEKEQKEKEQKEHKEKIEMEKAAKLEQEKAPKFVDHPTKFPLADHSKAQSFIPSSQRTPNYLQYIPQTFPHQQTTQYHTAGRGRGFQNSNQQQYQEGYYRNRIPPASSANQFPTTSTAETEQKKPEIEKTFSVVPPTATSSSLTPAEPVDPFTQHSRKEEIFGTRSAAPTTTLNKFGGSGFQKKVFTPKPVSSPAGTPVTSVPSSASPVPTVEYKKMRDFSNFDLPTQKPQEGTATERKPTVPIAEPAPIQKKEETQQMVVPVVVQKKEEPKYDAPKPEVQKPQYYAAATKYQKPAAEQKVKFFNTPTPAEKIQKPAEPQKAPETQTSAEKIQKPAEPQKEQPKEAQPAEKVLSSTPAVQQKPQTQQQHQSKQGTQSNYNKRNQNYNSNQKTQNYYNNYNQGYENYNQGYEDYTEDDYYYEGDYDYNTSYNQVQPKNVQNQRFPQKTQRYVPVTKSVVYEQKVAPAVVVVEPKKGEDIKHEEKVEKVEKIEKSEPKKEEKSVVEPKKEEKSVVTVEPKKEEEADSRKNFDNYGKKKEKFNSRFQKDTNGRDYNRNYNPQPKIEEKPVAKVEIIEQKPSEQKQPQQQTQISSSVSQQPQEKKYQSSSARQFKDKPRVAAPEKEEKPKTKEELVEKKENDEENEEVLFFAQHLQMIQKGEYSKLDEIEEQKEKDKKEKERKEKEAQELREKQQKEQKEKAEREAKQKLEEENNPNYQKRTNYPQKRPFIKNQQNFDQKPRETRKSFQNPEIQPQSSSNYNNIQPSQLPQQKQQKEKKLRNFLSFEENEEKKPMEPQKNEPKEEEKVENKEEAPQTAQPNPQQQAPASKSQYSTRNFNNNRNFNNSGNYNKNYNTNYNKRYNFSQSSASNETMIPKAKVPRYVEIEKKPEQPKIE